MLKLELFLNKTILVGLGLLFRWFIIGTLIAPYYAELGPLITDDFLVDHTPLYNVSLLAVALKARRASDPTFVDLFFSVQFLARHIIPACDAMFFYGLLICFQMPFAYTILVLSYEEHYLNVLATALYGPWQGVAVCCVLSSIACLTTYILVWIIQQLTRPWMVATSWNRKKAALTQMETIRAQITRLQMALQQETAEQEQVHLREEMTRQVTHWWEVTLQWMQVRLEELRMGDLHEEMLIELQRHDEPAYYLVIEVLLQRPLIVSSFGAITLATMQWPPGLVIPAFGLGYLPYALFGVYTGNMLPTMSEEELLEDQVPYWRFSLWFFALALVMCAAYVKSRFSDTRRLQEYLLAYESQIELVRMAFNGELGPIEEFNLEDFQVEEDEEEDEEEEEE